MEDIVPSLLDKIATDFDLKVGADNEIEALLGKITSGKGNLHDVSLYARRLGDLLSMTLQENLTQDVLPDGKMYYNIADRIITPMMRQNFNLSLDQAQAIQALVDEKSKIGISSIRPDFPVERVQQIVDSLTEDTEFEVIQRRMGEPVANCSHSFVDDFVRANAEYRAMAGLETSITRTLVGGACPYCTRLAGSWIYGEEPTDVYKRHDSCRCTVTFNSKKGYRQDVHTKIKTILNPQELQDNILERS